MDRSPETGKKKGPAANGPVLNRGGSLLDALELMVDVLARGVGIATTGETGIGRRFGCRHRAHGPRRGWRGADQQDRLLETWHPDGCIHLLDVAGLSLSLGTTLGGRF